MARVHDARRWRLEGDGTVVRKGQRYAERKEATKFTSPFRRYEPLTFASPE